MDICTVQTACQIDSRRPSLNDVCLCSVMKHEFSDTTCWTACSDRHKLVLSRADVRDSSTSSTCCTFDELGLDDKLVMVTQSINLWLNQCIVTCNSLCIIEWEESRPVLTKSVREGHVFTPCLAFRMIDLCQPSWCERVASFCKHEPYLFHGCPWSAVEKIEFRRHPQRNVFPQSIKLVVGQWTSTHLCIINWWVLWFANAEAILEERPTRDHMFSGTHSRNLKIGEWSMNLHSPFVNRCWNVHTVSDGFLALLIFFQQQASYPQVLCIQHFSITCWLFMLL